MTKDEAIHKALKVLNCLNNDRVYETAWVKGAINACEEALEQPTVAELNDEYLRDTNVIGLEQPAEPRLVSYALDGSTCTLNIDGEEVYFNREQPAQEPVGWLDANEMLAEFMHKDLKNEMLAEFMHKDLKAEHEKRGSFTPRDFPIPVYLHPYQWQGLTDDEIDKIYASTEPDSKMDTYYMILSRAIEQALRIKNG